MRELHANEINFISAGTGSETDAIFQVINQGIKYGALLGVVVGAYFGGARIQIPNPRNAGLAAIAGAAAGAVVGCFLGYMVVGFGKSTSSSPFPSFY